jgi:hypothetical protein
LNKEMMSIRAHKAKWCDNLPTSDSLFSPTTDGIFLPHITICQDGLPSFHCFHRNHPEACFDLCRYHLINLRLSTCPMPSIVPVICEPSLKAGEILHNMYHECGAGSMKSRQSSPMILFLPPNVLPCLSSLFV